MVLAKDSSASGGHGDDDVSFFLRTFACSFNELPSMHGYLPASLPRSTHNQALACLVPSPWAFSLSSSFLEELLLIPCDPS